MNCYLCGNPNADRPLQLKDSFTAHAQARSPQSDKMCDRCDASINGNEKQLWYWNAGKDKWSKLWGRSLSRLYQGDRLVVPTINSEHTEGKDTLLVVSGLATREQMRSWLLNPPEPPFTIAIAESGQKHILPWAQEAYDRNQFPVQFEMDSLTLDRAEFTALLQAYETLMGLGFSKSEINDGNYRPDRLLACDEVDRVWELNEQIQPYRATRLFELVGYVAIAPDTSSQ